MSMKIHDYNKSDKIEYDLWTKKKEEDIKENDEKENNTNKIVIKDTYTHSEESDNSNNYGLYRLGRDEFGGRKIMFDNGHKKENKEEKTEAAGAEKEEEKHTIDTSKVDREIEKLKKEKSQLERQVKAASKDEKKAQELKKRLAEVNNQLNQKDNDAYRKQHATVI